MNRISATLQHVYASGFRQRFARLAQLAGAFAHGAVRCESGWTGSSTDMEALCESAFHLWLWFHQHDGIPACLDPAPDRRLAGAAIRLGIACNRQEKPDRYVSSLFTEAVRFSSSTGASHGRTQEEGR